MCIRDRYGGNSSYNTAKSSVLIQTVNPTTPTVALTSSLNPSTVGASVTFTATLSGSGALPAAAVTFLDGTTTLGTVTPSGGVATFTTTALASGSHSILASFVGGTNYYPAKSSVVTQTVNAVNSTSYINYSSNGFTSSNLSMNNGPSAVSYTHLDATAGTTIYYTTNGSTPTTSSAVYSGPITVSATETLNAIAAETGYSNSPVATAVYTIKSTLPAPAFSPAGGTYTCLLYTSRCV